MEPIKQMPTSVRVASILRKAILSGDYAGGEELSLTQLAKELGVSRTPIREALQKLNSEGLITLRMNKGAIVNKIDQKFITDHFEVRILLESEAVKRAIARHLDVTDLLAQAKQLLDSHSTNIDDYVQLNQTIHTTIWHAADNNKLTEILEELWNGSSTNTVYPPLEHHLKSAQEHVKLLTAIQNGESQEACDIMKAHLVRSMNNILASFSARQPNE